MMTPRELFEQAYAEWGTAAQAFKAERDQVTRDYDAALLVEATRCFGRARKPLDAFIASPDFKAWQAPWHDVAKAIAVNQADLAATLRTRLRELATEAPCLPATEAEQPYRLLESAWDSTYQSTGNGSHYAHCRAQLAAYEASHLHHITAQVRRWEERQYDVYVLVATDLDVELLKLKPGLTVREWVKFCWSKQCQPRVFNPWLDPDFERKHGLDYFGGDLPNAVDIPTPRA